MSHGALAKKKAIHFSMYVGHAIRPNLFRSPFSGHFDAHEQLFCLLPQTCLTCTSPNPTCVTNASHSCRDDSLICAFITQGNVLTQPGSKRERPEGRPCSQSLCWRSFRHEKDHFSVGQISMKGTGSTSRVTKLFQLR